MSWTGAGDGHSFSDPNNWVGGIVPNSADEAIINAAGTTVNIASNATLASIYSTANLNITGGLAVTSGTSTVSGAMMVASGSSLSASGSGTSLTGGGAISANGASFYASGGALLSLPGITSYTENGATWQASGTGSQVLLASLAGIASGLGTLNIDPQSGGEISLPSLTAITNSYVNITASGAGSVVSMPELASFSNSNGNGVEFLNAISGGLVIDPALKTAVGVYLTLSGAGSQMNTSQLASLTYGSISVDQTANFNGLTDIDGMYLYASNGATLSLPGVERFGFNQNVNGRTWQASGTGTLIGPLGACNHCQRDG